MQTAYGGIKLINVIPILLHKTNTFEYGEVYSIQHYVIKFVSDLRQVGGFLLG